MINFDQDHSIFRTNVRISTLDAFHPDAVWPHNIEIAIMRVPVRIIDGYSCKMIAELAQKLKNHLVKNGIVFMIVYSPVEKRSRPFEVSYVMEHYGFTHIDNIIIQKTWYPGKRSENTLVNGYEYVLHFCNGDTWKLDRTPISEYLNTDSNSSCPGNIWSVRTGSLSEAYPLDLAELLIKMTDALPGSAIFDPFMKNSSSLTAALKLGHSFYGFETDLKRVERYSKLVDKYKKTGKI